MDGGAQRALGGLLGPHLDEAAKPVEIPLRSRLGRGQWFEAEVGWLARCGPRDVHQPMIDGEGPILTVEAG